MCRGDIIVGGLNFGAGSSRPAARSLRNLGIAAPVAESVNGLFFRNAANYGLLALERPGGFMGCSRRARPPRCRSTSLRCATAKPALS